jgi:ectoine hydroxylase-related dioxygenase (phytanoyl-CoA dioxygenase family)
MTDQLVAAPAVVLDLAAQLRRNGFCIIPDLLPSSILADLDGDLAPVFARTPFCQGDFYGQRTKRFGSLLRRSPHAAVLAVQPTILGIVDAILGEACDRVQLNVAQAIEIHSGALPQVPHRDHDMWQGEKGAHEYLVNVIWPLTSFTADNGATQFYPDSHGPEGMARTAIPEPLIAQCEPGSAICFLGSTLHGAGGNRTTTVRRGIVMGYSLGWLKAYENQTLAYPPNVACRFPPDLAALVGYAQHRPNLGNYEGQCPSILLHDDVPDHLAAIDALRPDQAFMVSDFVDVQKQGIDRPWLAQRHDGPATA